MTGNIISATKVEPDGVFAGSAASGVWNLQDQYDYVRGDNWPQTGNFPRAYFLGGSNGSNNTDVISYINMTTTGMDSIDFGDLAANQGNTTGCSSSTRGLIGGGLYWTGSTNSTVNTIQYITMTTSGSGQDFGDLSVAGYDLSATSNSTRGIWGGRWTGSFNDTMDYVTIASTGNASDFGNLAQGVYSQGATSSTTRAVFAGGYYTPSHGRDDTIQYVTIASTGNSTDFGNLTVARGAPAGASSNTRAIFCGGFGSSVTNIIDYITIASTGNATDFGDTQDTHQDKAGTSNKILGFIAGGSNGETDRIERITIASTGNSVDFGNLTGHVLSVGGCSTAHGGLA